MRSKTVRRVSLAAVSSVVSLAMIGWSGAVASSSLDRSAQGAQPRISSYSISITPTIAKAGAIVSIRVSNVFNAKSCQVSLLQGRKSVKGRLGVRNYTAVGRVRVPADFRGATTARVGCGKDGTAISDPFMVVGPNEPTSASCTVVEHGFGTTEDYAYSGLRVTNSSPTLSTGGVEIALTYRDASGRVLKTDTIYHYDGIPPATTVILAGSTEVSYPSSLSVASRCTTSADPAPPVLPSRAYLVGSGSSRDVVGEIQNTLSRTVARFSEVNYLVRGSSGSIIGGGTSDLDSFVVPGAVGTWEDYVYSDLPYKVSDGIEANVFVDFED
jgi:hypothetical protein